jgi:hypothetical protein
VPDPVVLGRLFEPSGRERRWQRGEQLNNEELHNRIKNVTVDIFHFLIMNVMYDVSERLSRSDGPNRAGCVILLVPKDGGTATSRNVVLIKYIFYNGQCAI